MEDKHPSWLKAMQNGALGEARARAFLMDRFWILERSVDIDGADLIIQIRITSQNLLDRNPPKFGIVQVKFYETENTTHYIPKVYILDGQGNLREEFFLLCHTGYEENSQIFFLTSEMITSDFELVVKSDIEKYCLSGFKVFRNKKYLVQSNANTLSRIENKLAFADFKRNREFISWTLPMSTSDSKAILPDYNEPLVNSWGDIPKNFQKIKESALKAMNEIESTYYDLKAIAEEVDPLEAFGKIEMLDYSGYGYWGRETMENLYDEDFYYTCRNHKDKVETLRSDGLLDKFMKTKEVLMKNVSEFLCQRLPIDVNTIHTVIIEFTEDFDIISTKHNLIPASEYFDVSNDLNHFGHVEIPTSSYRGIKEISEHSFEYFWLAGRIYIGDEFKNDLQRFYQETDFWIYNECLDKMYELKY